MQELISQYYRCPERYVRLNLAGPLLKENGYFRFGNENLCYGQVTRGAPSPTPNGNLCDVLSHVASQNGITYLPFDLQQVVNNLRYELYANTSCNSGVSLDSKLRDIYYYLRPLMPAGVRKFLQRTWILYRRTLPFPEWPVDRTVDRLVGQSLLLLLRAQGLKRIPFIWFWPEGALSCAIIGHDVETTLGREFCTKVMDLDEAYGIRSAFSIVPERRYELPSGFLESIWSRNFEVIIQGLNHDGDLFRNRKDFLECVELINAYGSQYGATGFRSPVLYRNQLWFDALKFSYDTSVPNVGLLEAQRGGCCTVMPYFVGNVLELPVTTTQDYALFNYLNMYSLDLWKRQIQLIMEQHGLANFIVHPDYITKRGEWDVYESLLAHLTHLREHQGLWIPKPAEVDLWWRQRAKMTLVETRKGARIEGQGSERARVAYASEESGKLMLTIEREA